MKTQWSADRRQWDRSGLQQLTRAAPLAGLDGKTQGAGRQQHAAVAHSNTVLLPHLRVRPMSLQRPRDRALADPEPDRGYG